MLTTILIKTLSLAVLEKEILMLVVAAAAAVVVFIVAVVVVVVNLMTIFSISE
jgi:hypothetical protein